MSVLGLCVGGLSNYKSEPCDNHYHKGAVDAFVEVQTNLLQTLIRPWHTPQGAPQTISNPGPSIIFTPTSAAAVGETRVKSEVETQVQAAANDDLMQRLIAEAQNLGQVPNLAGVQQYQARQQVPNAAVINPQNNVGPPGIQQQAMRQQIPHVVADNMHQNQGYPQFVQQPAAAQSNQNASQGNDLRVRVAVAEARLKDARSEINHLRFVIACLLGKREK